MRHPFHLFRPAVIGGLVLLAASCSVQRTVAVDHAPAGNYICIGMTPDGDCIIRATLAGASVDQAVAAARKGAVQALLFEGIPGHVEDRVPAQDALVKDPGVRTDRAAWFRGFLSGPYQGYASLFPGTPPQVVRTSSGVRATVTIVLRKDSLRKELEKEGIIQPLFN